MLEKLGILFGSLQKAEVIQSRLLQEAFGE
jgi:hypothetical protein